VRNIRPATESDVWINGGFFAFRREIFNYLRDGEDLVDGALQRLLVERQLTHIVTEDSGPAWTRSKKRECLTPFTNRARCLGQCGKAQSRMAAICRQAIGVAQERREQSSGNTAG
jgi:hypothetical protein